MSIESIRNGKLGPKIINEVCSSPWLCLLNRTWNLSLEDEFKRLNIKGISASMEVRLPEGRSSRARSFNRDDASSRRAGSWSFSKR